MKKFVECNGQYPHKMYRDCAVSWLLGTWLYNQIHSYLKERKNQLVQEQFCLDERRIKHLESLPDWQWLDSIMPESAPAPSPAPAQSSNNAGVDNGTSRTQNRHASPPTKEQDHSIKTALMESVFKQVLEKALKNNSETKLYSKLLEMLHENKDNESPWVGKCVLPKKIQDTQCGVIIDLWFNDDKELTYKIKFGDKIEYWKISKVLEGQKQTSQKMWSGNHKKM